MSRDRQAADRDDRAATASVSQVTLLAEADVIRALSQRCELTGGQAAWAAQHGIARSVLCETLSGKRGLSEAVANAAGFVRVTRYVPMRGKPNA
jgi:hypothetical protein